MRIMLRFLCGALSLFLFSLRFRTSYTNYFYVLPIYVMQLPGTFELSICALLLEKNTPSLIKKEKKAIINMLNNL